MDDKDLSLFTQKKPLPDSDEEDFGFERPKFTRRHAENFGKPIEEDAFDMEKYRPHNFEVGRPKGDDINDLVEYYSKYKTTRNAMARTNISGGMRPPNNEFYEDPQDDFNPRGPKKFSDPNQRYSPDDEFTPPPQAPPRRKMSNPDDYNIERRRPSYEFGETLDPATRLILMKNSDPSPRMRYNDDISNEDSYSRQNFSNQSRHSNAGNNFNEDMDHLRPSPPAAERPSADTAMSSHTRMMLDKLKQSTQELQEITDGDDDIKMPPVRRGAASGRQQKKSRFLRNNVNSDGPIYEEDNDNTKYVNSLANSILGLRNDTMGDFDKYRPEPARMSPPRRHSRKNFDFNDDLPVAPQKKFVDDDDTDAMIANLKQKTTRKAATDILRDIETDPADFVKFEPIKSFKDTFRPSPEPEVNRYGSLNRMNTKPKKSYLDQDDTPNPFSSLRGRNNDPPTSMSSGRSRMQSNYAMDDDDFGGGMGGYGRQQQQQQQPSYGGSQQYGSLGRNGLGPAQQQQQPQYMQQQPQQMQQPMYGGYSQNDMGGGGYGQDLYGMGGGMQMQGMSGGYGYGGPQFQQPYGQQQQPQGYFNGMGSQGGYDQMSFGSSMGGYGQQQQQQQFQGSNLRQARHQRYGANNGGW